MKKEKKKFKIQNKKAFVWLLLGLLFLGYYLVEALFVGFGYSLLWIWAAGGIVFLLCAFLTKRYGKLPIPKKLFRLLCVLIAICAVFFCLVEGLILSAMGADGEPDLDYIIVLGARVKNGAPSKALLWRIDATETYLNDNPDTVAILSGGQGPDESISEAQCMYNVLTARGIDGARLILEEKSTDTNENLRNSLALIEEGATVGVVTNNFHVYRATHIAEHVLGREVSGIATPYKNAMLLHYMVREFAGIVVDTLEGNMRLFG